MESNQETDLELEKKARAQAAAIAQSKAEAHAQQVAMSSVWHAIGKALHISRQEPLISVQKPGRELLLWQMKESSDVSSALEIVFLLLEEPGFMATVPKDIDCPIIVFQARRRWNDAAKEWSGMGGGEAQTWLRCDRKLLIRKQAGVCQLYISRKDLCVSFDKTSAKLVPTRVENKKPMDLQQRQEIMDAFPSLSVAQLVEGFKAPTRYFKSVKRGRSPDAYIANGPLVPVLELFNQGKKKPQEDKEDPNKGLANWLASVIKAQATTK